MKRLVLGTAQIGLDYGIINNVGMPSYAQAVEIVSCAWENGIRAFDTAQAYGQSEKTLGRIFRELNISSKVKVITKIDPKIDMGDSIKVRQSVENSLTLLGCEKLEGIMLHEESNLDHWHQGLDQTMIALMDNNFTRSIGVSVYHPEFALKAMDIPEMNLIQLPFNLLDNRFEKAGIFKKAGKFRKTIYTRSVFLQGLILSGPNQIPDHLKSVKPIVRELEKIADHFKLSRAELAIGYAKSAYADTRVLFGAETSDQVLQNLKMWNRVYPEGLVEKIQNKFGAVDERIVNPARWSN